MKAKSLILFYGILLMVILFLFPSHGVKASDENPETVILQLRWFHQFQFAGYYAAVEQGYYRDVGLDVIIKETKAGMDTTRR
ncbi:MAG TPA: hypothetical protein ENI07_06975 [Desulfobacterales bacterium]|nr:hypothetical protein [Desulfobacterales bacterium]